MEKQQGNAFLMRNFPPDLKAKAQHYCIDKGINLRKLIILALEIYLGKHYRQPKNEINPTEKNN